MFTGNRSRGHLHIQVSIVACGGLHEPQTHPVSIKYGLRTADCGLRTADYGLRTGYKIWTRYKTRTRKYGLGIKHGQGIKRGLRTGYKILTTDYFGKNRANWF